MSKFQILQEYLADRVAPTLIELRQILPEKLFMVERGFMDGPVILSEIAMIAESHEEAGLWIRKEASESIVEVERRNFQVRQSTRTRQETRFWTHIMKLSSDDRRGPRGTGRIQCGTYYSITEIELRDLALHLNNR